MHVAFTTTNYVVYKFHTNIFDESETAFNRINIQYVVNMFLESKHSYIHIGITYTMVR